MKGLITKDNFIYRNNPLTRKRGNSCFT